MAAASRLPKENRLENSSRESLIYSLQKRRIKRVSKYKIRKQVGFIEQIIDDPQIMDC